jgi:hypothetical protein
VTAARQAAQALVSGVSRAEPAGAAAMMVPMPSNASPAACR